MISNRSSAQNETAFRQLRTSASAFATSRSFATRRAVPGHGQRRQFLPAGERSRFSRARRRTTLRIFSIATIQSGRRKIFRYVKDLGINLLRWESKISSEHIVELADEAGIPVMFGWMCCNQWEKWDQWSEEDHRVAPESLRSQILMLRPHASAFLWANGSDGRPPDRFVTNTIASCRSALAKRRSGHRLFFCEGCER